MVNVFGDSIASGQEGGNLQVVKRVVTTVGKYGDYTKEIQQSYELGFSPYRLHTNGDGTFVTLIRAYEVKVIVLDDVSRMEVSNRQVAVDTISSKLIYFVKASGGGDMFALLGDRGPTGAKIPVIVDPPEVEVQLESVMLKEPKVLLKSLVK